MLQDVGLAGVEKDFTPEALLGAAGQRRASNIKGTHPPQRQRDGREAMTQNGLN